MDYYIANRFTFANILSSNTQTNDYHKENIFTGLTRRNNPTHLYKKKWSDFSDLTPNKQITQNPPFCKHPHPHTHKRKHEAFIFKNGIATSSRCACTHQAVMLPSTDPGWAGLWTWTTTWSEWRARSSTRKVKNRVLFVDRKPLKENSNRVIRCTLSAR